MCDLKGKWAGADFTLAGNNLRKIKAIGDLMAVAERDSAESFSMESMQELGYMVSRWAVAALKIVDPPEDEEEADPA